MVYRPQFFKLQELICPHVYNRFGDMAWLFLDDKCVIILDWLRRSLDKPIAVNDWHEGGRFDERGLRCIQCSLVKERQEQGVVYVSAHLLGRAYDFDVDGMTADEVRVWLALNKSQIPYNIRLERNVSWVHMDTYDNGNKLTFFSP